MANDLSELKVEFLKHINEQGKNGSKFKANSSLTLRELASIVRLGKNGVKKYSEKIWEFDPLVENGHRKLRTMKSRLCQSVVPTGTFEGFRHEDNFKKPNGILFLDIDDKDMLKKMISADVLREKLEKSPYSVLVYHSISTLGIHAYIHVEPIPQSLEEHRNALNFTIKVLGLTGIVDNAVQTRVQAAFIPYDKNIYINFQPEVLRWQAPAGDAVDKLDAPALTGTGKKSNDILRVRSALKYIDGRDPTVIDYATWVKIGMALKSYLGDAGLKVWKAHSADHPEYDEDEHDAKWESFSDDEKAGSVGIGTIFYMALNNGWKPPLNVRKEGDLNYGGIARNFLRMNKNSLVFVESTAKNGMKITSPYLLDKKGFWVYDEGRLFMLAKMALDDLGRQLIASNLKKEKVSTSWAKLYTDVIDPTGRNKVIKLLYSEMLGLEAEYGGGFGAIKKILESDLNANPIYLGVGNGIVDLTKGDIVDALELKDSYVTQSTSINFTHATHWSVDKLFENLLPEIREYLLQNLGRALYNQGAKQLLFLIGPTDSGKTSLFASLHATLEAQASDIPKEVFVKAKYATNSTLNPEHAALVSARICTIEEMQLNEIDPALFKRILSDVAPFTVNAKHKAPVTRTISATVLSAANKPPMKFHLEDEAMRGRIKIIEYEKPPTKDLELKTVLTTNKKSKEAMLSLLIRYAKKVGLVNEIVEPQTIKNSLLDLMENAGVGELQRFVENFFVSGPTDGRSVAVLHYDDAYDAWMMYNEDDEKKYGIASRDAVVDMIYSIHRLGKENKGRRVKVSGGPALRCIVGLRCITEEELESKE